MAAKQGLQWVDANIQSELRWGTVRGVNQPLRNSTRVAVITRNSDKITDAGQVNCFTVKLATMFNDGSIKEDESFATLDAAKDAVLRALISHLRQMANQASDLADLL